MYLASLVHCSRMSSGGCKAPCKGGAQSWSTAEEAPWLGWLPCRDAEDQLLVSHLLEDVTVPASGAKGVGMCAGPVFSAAPTFAGSSSLRLSSFHPVARASCSAIPSKKRGPTGPLRADWVQYHADMGVDAIHMYAVLADFILSPHGGGYMHSPGNYKALSIEHHRVLHWKVFHPSPWSMHYYGQWLIHNDCVFRWRHTFEFIIFLDRDEFLHFPGQRPSQVKPIALSGFHFKIRCILINVSNVLPVELHFHQMHSVLLQELLLGTLHCVWCAGRLAPADIWTLPEHDSLHRPIQWVVRCQMPDKACAAAGRAQHVSGKRPVVGH